MFLQGCKTGFVTILTLCFICGCTAKYKSWPERSSEKPESQPSPKSEEIQTAATEDEDHVSRDVDQFVQRIGNKEHAAHATDDNAAQSMPNVNPPDESGSSVNSMSAMSLDTAPTRSHSNEDSILPSVERVSVKPLESGVIQPMQSDVIVPNTPAYGALPVADPSIRQEIEKLEEFIQREPSQWQHQLRLKYLYLAEGMQGKALSIPHGLARDRSELLHSMVQANLSTEEILHDPQSVNAESLTRIQSLYEHALQHTNLAIPTMQLCVQVQSFGSYKPIPEHYFVSGNKLRAVVYCEVDHFASVPREDGVFETKITHQLELLTPEGHRVWSDTQPVEIVDHCRKRRRDFFFNRVWQLPDGLQAGRYVLKTIIEDKNKSQVAEATCPIQLYPAGYASHIADH